MNRILQILAQVSISPGDLDIPKPEGGLTDDNVKNAIRLAFGLAGGIALIIVTIAGFKYVLSQGNPQETAKAKNTILYALIGLAVSVTSYAIVTFFVTEATR